MDHHVSYITVSMDSKGRVVMPKKLRDAANLEPGQLIASIDKNGDVLLRSRKSIKNALHAEGAKYSEPGRAVGALFADRRAQAESENSRRRRQA
jgi:bifunctional DNA-binding transcriptional regulator/antitoxin component of YhaV-PrlF toxin-antitoxin module